ncbi:four-carbon acid sugar kinase family protein [Aneurinibacillus sp. Ricciae_BoGa-3]|uniref:four-carbon acid sugar kinase family protein n=1 Tax=Aneurinibacillus sp. Ricciae_BoGa-3 TaxID=3022697 RepID=UPI0023401BC9|nr:four-carbon acid sugar kinase family protein [Aneurinibacillus sp. Ricciae_BoGa-3]WCK52650.1 four-carbon acid sugar kinase family protein [Aneurinibacillus sp. Ricciae_BoGa-3]
MREIAIIADDLTGASDAGVQFARKGLKSIILFQCDNLVASTADIEALIVDTDSRALPENQAYFLAVNAAKRVKEAGFCTIYKKIDSTLRGNPGAEIEAVMDVFAFNLAVIAPAFPGINRTTVHGTHLVNGIPVHQTEFGRDPKCPVTEANLLHLFNRQCKRRAGLVDLFSIRAGKDSIFNKVDELKSQGVSLLIFDAETEDDLKQAAFAMSEYADSVLWAGSAGLADFLPAALKIDKLPVKSPVVSQHGDSQVMLVAGSASEITRKQLAHFMLETGVEAVKMDPLLIIGEETQPVEQARCIQALQDVLAKGDDVALFVESSAEAIQAAQKAGSRKGWSNAEVSNKIAESLGAIAAEAIKTCGLKLVILTGGDTAKAVCSQLHATGIQLLDEVEPGIPISRLAGVHDLLVVTKAGAFGSLDAFNYATNRLKGEIKYV